MKDLLKIIILICVASVGFAQNAEKPYSFKEEFSLEHTSALTILADNGNIHIDAHQSDKLVVMIEVYRANELLKISRDEFLKRYGDKKRIKTKHQGNETKIAVKSFSPNGYQQPDDNIIIHFKILVPQKTAVTLSTHDGFIKAYNLKGMQSYTSYDGDVFLTNLGGQIVAKAFDGDIIQANVYGQVEYEIPDGAVIEKSE